MEMNYWTIETELYYVTSVILICFSCFPCPRCTVINTIIYCSTLCCWLFGFALAMYPWSRQWFLSLIVVHLFLELVLVHCNILLSFWSCSWYLLTSCFVIFSPLFVLVFLASLIKLVKLVFSSFRVIIQGIPLFLWFGLWGVYNILLSSGLVADLLTSCFVIFSPLFVLVFLASLIKLVKPFFLLLLLLLSE